MAGRAASIGASTTKSLGGLAALGLPARIGLIAAVLLVVVGTGAWVAWPARQVARETPTPSRAAPREAAVPVTPPSPASSETTPPAVAPPAVAAPVPAASAGASAPGASRESEPASRAAQGSPASLQAPAPAAPAAPPEAPAAKRAKTPAAPPKSAMAGPAPAAPQVSPRAPEAAPATDSLRASPRCSRLLQRAAVGETLTPDEQRELASSCR
jgi:hypothetical protein